MRKLVGTVFILGGVFALADFTIFGTLQAGVAGAKSHLLLPLLSLGHEYPSAVMKLCTGIWLLVYGMYLVLLEGDLGRCPLSHLFLWNSLGLCFALLGAFAASQNAASSSYVGICAIAAGLHLLGGLALLYFAVTERPVGAAGLGLGSALYVSTAALGAVVYLSGKAA